MADLKLSPSRFDPLSGLRIVPKLSAKQRQLLQAVLLCAFLGERRLLIIGCIGEWGGGKTMIAMILFVVLCVINSDPTQKDPDLVPCSGIWAATEDDAKRHTIAELLQVVPPELIKKRTDEYILWSFGHKTWIYGARKSAQGGSLTHVLGDEIHTQEYARQWDNIQSRARSDRAVINAAIAVGLAERGHTERILKEPTKDAGRLAPLIFYRMLYPEENPANPPGYSLAVKAGTAGSRVRDKDGWLLKLGARYPKFSSALNIEPAGDRWPDRSSLIHLPISIGFDLKKRSSAVIMVPVPIRVMVPVLLPKGHYEIEIHDAVGWLVVDQVIIDDCGDGELAIKTAARIREMGWHVEPGVSVGGFDPQATSQELHDFKVAIPGLAQHQVTEGYFALEEHGCKTVDWNICDGLEQTRFFVHPDTVGESYRGVAESLRGWLAARPQDKMYEDTCDAVRYILQLVSPAPERPASPITIGAQVLELEPGRWNP